MIRQQGLKKNYLKEIVRTILYKDLYIKKVIYDQFVLPINTDGAQTWTFIIAILKKFRETRKL